MTAQIGESLYFKGQEHSMCEEPLSQFFSLAEFHPKFQETCTALWRGYIGRWEITENRLYMMDIDATMEDGSEVTLETIFPGFPKRAFADWYNGTLRIPHGQLLRYEHMGYGSEFERDLLIEIKKGVVINTQVKTNGELEIKHGPDGYGVGAFTVLDKDKKTGGKQ